MTTASTRPIPIRRRRDLRGTPESTVAALERLRDRQAADIRADVNGVRSGIATGLTVLLAAEVDGFRGLDLPSLMARMERIAAHVQSAKERLAEVSADADERLRDLRVRTDRAIVAAQVREATA